MGQQSFLPDIDRKRTQAAVEAALEKYRIYKYLSFDARQASITAAYSDMPRRSPTNVTSDQTASIAIYNTDQATYRQDYCDRVERAVQRMPQMERFLIEQRYLTTESDYITDQRVYELIFDPPISWPTYSKIRWRAFHKLALDLQIVVVRE